MSSQDKPTEPTRGITRGTFLGLVGAAATSSLFPGPLAAAPSKAQRTRPIPSTGEQLPVIGLGTSRVFDVGPSLADRESQKEVLKILFEAGGKVIDTSPMYGRAETVVGDLVAELDARHLAFLATKVWTRGRDAGIQQMDASFRKLQTAQMDLMQVHNLVDWKVQSKTLRAWKADGRIRYIGTTHYTTGALDDLAAVKQAEPWDFVQCAYSIGVRDAEERLLPIAADRGVAVLVNRPFERGRVFGKVRGKALPDWAAEFDCVSWGQFFLKFVLANPAVTCVIPGTSKPKHMTDNLGAGLGRLPDAAERKRMLRYFEDL